MKEKVVNFVKENDGTNQRETARVCMTSQTSVHRYLKEEIIKHNVIYTYIFIIIHINFLYQIG